jgi:hypothetical protein
MSLAWQSIRQTVNDTRLLLYAMVLVGIVVILTLYFFWTTDWKWLPVYVTGVLLLLTLVVLYKASLRLEDLRIEDLFNFLSLAPTDDHAARIQKVYEWRVERHKLFVQASFAALLAVVGLLIVSYMKGDFATADSPLSDWHIWKVCLIVLVDLAAPGTPLLFCYWRLRLADRQFLKALTQLMPRLGAGSEEELSPATEDSLVGPGIFHVLQNSFRRLVISVRNLLA